MNIRNVAVIRGGIGDERDVSMRTGSSLLQVLKPEFNLRDIVIDKEGNWIVSGLNLKPVKALSGIEVVLNALHGKFGEDGGVQQILEQIGVPFSGSKILSSSFAMHKKRTKDVAKEIGIKVPRGEIVRRENFDISNLSGIFRSYLLPVIIKPLSSGSSVGVTIARDFNSFVNSLEILFARYDALLVEEYIQGKEAVCGVVENFRNERLYPLMPVMVKGMGNVDYFSEELKKNGNWHGSIQDFSDVEKKALMDYAKKIHGALDLRHYSRSDFIVSPTRGVFLLEVNSLPGLEPNSSFVRSLESVGSSLSDFSKHLISLVAFK